MAHHETPASDDVPRLKGAYQDGGQFFREGSGALIAEYPGIVRHDFDMVGARMARRMFAADFPAFIVKDGQS